MNLVLDAKITWAVVNRQILQTSRIYIAAGLFFLILFILQWIFSIDQLLDVVLGDSGLTVTERLDYVLDGYINIFRYVGDIVPISMILISLLQSLTLTLLISFRMWKRVHAKQAAPITFGLLGVGCVACGGSVLTPLLGIVATNVSVSFAESLSIIFLILALVLSYISLVQTSYLVAHRRGATQKHA